MEFATLAEIKKMEIHPDIINLLALKGVLVDLDRRVVLYVGQLDEEKSKARTLLSSLDQTPFYNHITTKKFKWEKIDL